MKLMTCPINGPRIITEFAYGGEFRVMPDPETASDAEWSDYVFNRNSVPGVKREWWCHTPSGVWFIAERDTATDTIHRTYLYQPAPAGAPMPVSAQQTGPLSQAGQLSLLDLADGAGS